MHYDVFQQISMGNDSFVQKIKKSFQDVFIGVNNTDN